MQPKCQPAGNSKNYDHLWLATKMPAGQRSAPEERMTPIALLLLCLTSGPSRGHPGPQNQAPEVSPSKGEWPLLLCFCFAWPLTSLEVTLTPKIGLYSVWPLASPEVILALNSGSWGKPPYMSMTPITLLLLCFALASPEVTLVL